MGKWRRERISGSIWHYLSKTIDLNKIFFRRQRRFLGIRSHPDFVEAITIAFETSAASLEGLLRSGEGKLNIKSDLFSTLPTRICSEQCDSKKISYNCPTCSLIREGSYMKCGNSCPDCGADVVWMYVRRIIKIFSQSPIIFHRKFQLWKFWNWTTERDMIRSCCSVSKIDWSKSNDGIDG